MAITVSTELLQALMGALLALLEAIQKLVSLVHAAA